MVAITTGIIAGNIIRSNANNSYAASENITVTNNNQVITQEQNTSGTTTITRNSIVTVKDSSATYGYTLTARIRESTLPAGASVMVGGQTMRSTPIGIRFTNAPYATQPSGDTTEQPVKITLPANTPVGNYILDIEYGEDPVIIETMQAFTTAKCTALTTGQIVWLRDTRDNTIYRVKKMADNRCWMIDNLALDISTNYPGKPGGWNPVKIAAPTAVSATVPQIVFNNKTTSQDALAAGQIPNHNSPKQTYLYNWCAAMGDTSSNCANTQNYSVGQPTTPQTGVCPVPFRLPRGGASSAAGNEYATLDIAMGGTGTDRPNANTYSNWTTLPTSDPFGVYFGAKLSGYYDTVDGALLGGQGSTGFYWTSTVCQSGVCNLDPRSAEQYIKIVSGEHGAPRRDFAIRCIL